MECLKKKKRGLKRSSEAKVPKVLFESFSGAMLSEGTEPFLSFTLISTHSLVASARCDHGLQEKLLRAHQQ